MGSITPIRRMASAVVLASSFSLGGTALAQPTMTDKETARELFREGQELREKGDHEAAVEKLSRAHALVGTPITAVELARTHVELKHFVQARELLLSVARIPASANESEQTRAARREAAEISDQLRPRIATLKIALVRVPPERTPQVSVDGVTVAPAALPGYRVDPGRHEVIARVGQGAPARTEVTVGEGETKDVSLAPEVLDEPAPPPPPANEHAAPLSPPPAISTRTDETSSLVYIGFGLGAVGLTVGTITGVLALSKAGTSECEGTRCTSAGISDIESGRTLALVSTISFVAGVAGAGLGIYGLTFGSPKRTAVQLGPTLGGCALRGSF